MLTVTELTKSYGAELLFADLSFTLNPGERLALIGRNGTGKTTLLKILAGQEHYDSGQLSLAKRTQLGYLAQTPAPKLEAKGTLLAEAETVFAQVYQWEEQLRELEGKMAAAPKEQLEPLMQEYTRITSLFEASGGYSIRAKLRSVLFGLGFNEEELGKEVKLLSGGERMRLELAKLILAEPQVLLLDEPTNHLDLESVEWLEDYLLTLKSSMIIVSHDRAFLDKVTLTTYELEHKKGAFYRGNYSFYLEEKKQRQALAEKAFQEQEAKREKLQAFYEKWRNTPTRKNQAMSRKKALEKMELKEKPQSGQRGMALRFEAGARSAKAVLSLTDLSLSFEDKTLFSGVNLTLERGERIALVGPNGSGKTSLFKLILGQLAATEGEILWGERVNPGYFSQNLDRLNYDRTCLEEIMELPGFDKFRAHSLLGAFLFSGDDAEKKIATLSGGERNRLSLAKLMAQPYNLLLLDEPTNHLDLTSKEILEDALIEYPGSLILISHDRFFLDRLVAKVWAIENGSIKEYHGNYSAYRAEKLRLKEQEELKKAEVAPVIKKRPQKKPNLYLIAKKEEEIKRIEEEIEALEAEKTLLEEQLGEPETYQNEQGREIVASYEELKEELAALYETWEQLVI